MGGHQGAVYTCSRERFCMPDEVDVFVTVEEAHDYSRKLRFLIFLLTGGKEEEEDNPLPRYAAILLARGLWGAQMTQAELAEKIRCSQSTISKDLPKVKRLWKDADDLYLKFLRQLEHECCLDDTLQPSVFQFHLQVLKYVLKNKSAEEIMLLTETSNGKELMAALLRIYKVQRNFGESLRHHE